MEIYKVGGCVRDLLMGLEPRDIDYVVIGATVQQMEKKGFTQIGHDFPVFLHPQSHEEYALARVERKTGAGYHGFTVDTANVTLEEDLSRRDLTLNAMALASDGAVVDPHGGQADLRAKVLRHAGPAFSEDPLRILRVLRFHARFGPEWTIAPETEALMAEIVASGDAQALVPARIWKEVARALAEPHADLFVAGMHRLGLLGLPCFAPYACPVPALKELSSACRDGASLASRFCLAFAVSPSPVLFLQPEVPSSFRKTAQLFSTALQADLASYVSWDAAKRAQSQETLGVTAKSVHYAEVRQALGYLEGFSKECLAVFDHDASLLRAVDVKAISACMPAGPQVGQAIRKAKEAALQH